MKTKFLFLLISTLVIVSLAGCSSKKSNSNQDNTTTSSSDTSTSSSDTTTSSSDTSTSSSDTTTSSSDTTTSSLDTATSTTETETIFTVTDLAKYDGKNGNSAYVAISGVVYDVTGVKGWTDGKHQGYEAGKDLTAVISESPHGLSVLEKLTIVGKLE